MYRRMLSIVGAVFALALLLSFSPTDVVEAQGQRCFPETNLCISGAIRTYWERNGGLSIFGFPITDQRQEPVEGRNLQVQWFERDRLEIQADGAVTAGRLGVERLDQTGRSWQRGNKASPDPGCIVAPETGHQVCGAFATYWRNNGYVTRFGFPITGEIQETLNGKTFTVQYFERRRMELHPENAPPFNILLGLLGREVLDERNRPKDWCLQVPQSVNARIAPNCGPGGTRFEAFGVGFRPGENIGVYITLPDQTVFGAAFQVRADSSGTSEGVSFTSQPGFPTGVWAITFEGVSSGHKAIAYFGIKP